LTKLNFLAHPETQNQALILALMVLVPGIWWLFLGWSPADLLSQHDTLYMGYVYQRELIRGHGDWTSILYWPGLAGGAKVHDIIGSLPISQLLAYFNATPLIMSNTVVLFLQILFSYFCTRVTIGLSNVIYGNDAGVPYLVLILMGVLFAFLPFLGWRLPYGHGNIVFGLFVLLCFSCLFLDEMTGRRSVTSIIMCTLALCHSFQYADYQLIHYSLVFGAPIILGLTFAYPEQPIIQRFRWYILPASVFLGALLISMPKFYGMLTNALSGEMSRSEGSDVIYSYTVATLGDWLSSLPWSKDFISAGRQGFTHQEVNYPLGPLALLLLIYKPTIPFVRLAIGLAISLFLAVVAAMNISPLSTLMTSMIPLLESFRVPARSILPFLIFVSMVGLSALLKLIVSENKTLDKQGQYWALGALFLTLFALTPAILNDALLIAFILILYFLNKSKQLPTPFPFLMLAMLSGSAISAFSERALPPLKNPISETSVSSIRAAIIEKAPELESPLNRLSSDDQLRGVGFNSMYFLNLSSLSSYWFPLRRYAELVAELDFEIYNPATSVFHNHPARAGYDVLNRLYNVGWSMTFENGQPVVTRLNDVWGEAWISDRLTWSPSLGELAANLKSHGTPRELLLLSTDTDTEPAKSLGPPCTVVNEPRVSNPQFPMEVNLAVEGQCWLTISMNYSRILTATDQAGERLDTFPAYGALLGIVVQESTTGVTISPVESKLPASLLYTLAGFLLIIGIGIFAWKNPIQTTLARKDIFASAWQKLPTSSLDTGLQTIFGNRLVFVQMATIILVTLLAYSQVYEHHFVSDTIPYVLQNPWVHNVTLANTIAMFTEAHHANWQPLVWLSHSLDFYIFGMDAGKHHLVNLIFHVTNALLVYFLAIALMMRTAKFNLQDKQWVAFFTATIFAIHPQHVESVAWVVERKDVLYSLFSLSSLLAYLHLHTCEDRKTWIRILPFLLFVLSIMSKPMAVVLPIVLLILDFYPLNRCKLTFSALSSAIMEKWHYFAIAVCAMLVTLTTQEMAMPTAEQLPGWAKAINALDNSWFYVAHYINPTNLSPSYPYPDAETLTSMAFWIKGILFLGTILILGTAGWLRGVKWPLLLALFYIVTLLPVSGLVHVGPAKATDHYTYLATLPLSFLTALVIVALFQNLNRFKMLIAAISLSYLLFLFLITVQQVTYWNNPLTLWTRVVQLHPESALGHRNLAGAYNLIGEREIALQHAEESLRLGGPTEAYVKQLRLEISNQPKEE
jgi:protein O-mannosyl-transferase